MLDRMLVAAKLNLVSPLLKRLQTEIAVKDQTVKVLLIHALVRDSYLWLSSMKRRLRPSLRTRD